ncbi:hypothetical protein IFM89_029486 [Coptis chinensis]|uniref:Uncharacterized protein n=1 Tax=Coptis chinensis TaxID=261450 RepID=A0A835HYT1_9MAGN|nr:hypothetical protein IFM89_029486 [Coptis chinensis]
MAAAAITVREQATVSPQSPVRAQATVASQSPIRAQEIKSSEKGKNTAVVVGDQSEAMDSPTTSRKDSLLTYRNGDSSISRIHSSPVGIIIADSEAEKVQHLLEKKKQKRKRVNKSLLTKALISHSGNSRKLIYPSLGLDPDLGLVIGKNKVALTIYINKFPSFTMRCIFWNIRVDISSLGWKYQVSSRICSDHSPLLGGNISIPQPKNKPFKFFNMWCTHPTFRDIVFDSWQQPILGNSIFILTQKLKRLKGVLKKWNKDTFGNIKVKVEAESKKLEQMQDQFEKGNVTEDFATQMVDQENQVELQL